MSFDLTYFTGLAQGGTQHAPPETSRTYGWTYTNAWDGGTYNCDKVNEFDIVIEVSCPAPFESDIAVASLPDFEGWAGGDAFNPDPGDPSPHLVNYSVDAPAADYMTVYVDIGDLDELVGYTEGCELIGDGGGCGPAATPLYTMEADIGGGGSTFVPDTTQDGNNRGLTGYLKRGSAAYTSDPDNTASDYLWPASEITSLVWQLNADFHHAAMTSSLLFLIRPFWEPQGYICLV